MQSDELKHQWPRLRRQVQKRWPRLTDDDLAAIDGDHAYLIEALVARYRFAEVEAEREWRSFAGGVGNGHESVLAELKHSASEALAPGTQKIREGLSDIGSGLRTLAGDARFATREGLDDMLGATREGIGNALGAARGSVGDAVERARLTTEDAADRSLAELAGSAKGALEKAEQFVRDRPFAALGIAFVAGWLILGRR